MVWTRIADALPDGSTYVWGTAASNYQPQFPLFHSGLSANGLNDARHRFRFVEPAVIDGQAAIREFFVNIDETFAKTDIFHRVILRTLDRGSHDKLKRDR